MWPEPRRWIASAIVLTSLACGKGGPPPKSGPPAVPVSVETARTEDMPQLARSMGTVQSLNQVTVRTQVAGVLTEVLFREGQVVKRGELLARIDDRVIAAELAAAKAEKRKSEAQLASARIDLVRYQNLLQQEAIARQVIDQQTALVEQLEATVAANDAAVAVAAARLSYTRILSPVDGRVGLRRIDPGNVVQPSDAEGLVMVTQLEPIAVVFALSQDFLPVLQPVLHTESAPPVVARDRPSGGELAQGKLSVVDNQVDRATGTVQLKAEFANADRSLWPGQSVSVELQTGFSPGAVVVSSKSVQRGLKGSFVYRVRDDKAELVHVRTGHVNDDLVVILEGLSSGDLIVSDGHSRLTPGAKVKVVNSAAGSPSVAKEM
jgi:RND family efflux transporter MFP subunit